MSARRASECRIGVASVEAYRVPTASPESDGTYAWDHTTLVVVELEAEHVRGLGYSYADAATAQLAEQLVREHIAGGDAFATAALLGRLNWAVRNLGRPGIAAMAISAIDVALWDLKARLLGLPLFRLLGAARTSAPVYGSGGFTSYSDAELQRQLAGWVKQGIPRVKMKVGREPGRDPERVRAARAAIGPHAELFVDANGAYARQEALALANEFAAAGVTWFEEPVVAADVEGLRALRRRLPAGMELAVGEYGYTPDDFRLLLERDAVHVLQADATRCGGISGYLAVAALCEAFHIPLSAHCAPSLHMHLGCACRPQRHLEFFFDHERIERELFEGFIEPRGGAMTPDADRPGLGLTLKRRQAQRWAA